MKGWRKGEGKKRITEGRENKSYCCSAMDEDEKRRGRRGRGVVCSFVGWFFVDRAKMLVVFFLGQSNPPYFSTSSCACV
jgi:hypothetical protein